MAGFLLRIVSYVREGSLGWNLGLGWRFHGSTRGILYYHLVWRAEY